MPYYYEEKPEVKFKRYAWSARVRGFDIDFVTGSGVFSAKRIDLGTKALIEGMIIKKDWEVLDLGCGYGAVGIIAAKMGAKVILTDVNASACSLARQNLKLNNVKGKVIQSQGFEMIKKSFDSILFNPPFSAGLKACFSLIIECRSHLKQGGLLQVVARNKVGGKRFKELMLSEFSNCEVIYKKGGYFVYASKKESSEKEEGSS